ncbi:hypothetical protein H6B10_16990, partial [Gemmiger formicilis]|nr:hypothetical protein [Gemmiger formicilis]
DLWRRLNYIRQTGNTANHADRKPVTPEEAALCLENLWFRKEKIEVGHGGLPCFC